MKNTIILNLDNDAACECLDKIADGTNRIVIQAHSERYNYPIFNLTTEGYSKNVDVGKENGTFDFEIPNTLIFNCAEFSLNIGGIGKVVNLLFLNETSLEGNLITEKKTERGFINKSNLKNKTGVPIATRSSLGVIKVGEGLNIEPDGELSSEAGDLEAMTEMQIDNICT